MDWHDNNWKEKVPKSQLGWLFFIKKGTFSFLNILCFKSILWIHSSCGSDFCMEVIPSKDKLKALEQFE